jgi:ClpP class serine protease
MVEGRWRHDYPITAGEAGNLRIPVKTEVPAKVYQLMKLYPAPYAPPRTRRGEQQRR